MVQAGGKEWTIRGLLQTNRSQDVQVSSSNKQLDLTFKVLRQSACEVPVLPLHQKVHGNSTQSIKSKYSDVQGTISSPGFLNRQQRFHVCKIHETWCC